MMHGNSVTGVGVALVVTLFLSGCSPDPVVEPDPMDGKDKTDYPLTVSLANATELILADSVLMRSPPSTGQDLAEFKPIPQSRLNENGFQVSNLLAVNESGEIWFPITSDKPVNLSFIHRDKKTDWVYFGLASSPSTGAIGGYHQCDVFRANNHTGTYECAFQDVIPHDFRTGEQIPSDLVQWDDRGNLYTLGHLWESDCYDMHNNSDVCMGAYPTSESANLIRVDAESGVPSVLIDTSHGYNDIVEFKVDGSGAVWTVSKHSYGYKLEFHSTLGQAHTLASSLSQDEFTSLHVRQGDAIAWLDRRSIHFARSTDSGDGFYTSEVVLDEVYHRDIKALTFNERGDLFATVYDFSDYVLYQLGPFQYRPLGKLSSSTDIETEMFAFDDEILIKHRLDVTHQSAQYGKVDVLSGVNRSTGLSSDFLLFDWEQDVTLPRYKLLDHQAHSHAMRVLMRDQVNDSLVSGVLKAAEEGGFERIHAWGLWTGWDASVRQWLPRLELPGESDAPEFEGFDIRGDSGQWFTMRFSHPMVWPTVQDALTLQTDDGQTLPFKLYGIGTTAYVVPESPLLEDVSYQVSLDSSNTVLDRRGRTLGPVPQEKRTARVHVMTAERFYAEPHDSSLSGHGLYAWFKGRQYDDFQSLNWYQESRVVEVEGAHRLEFNARSDTYFQVTVKAGSNYDAPGYQFTVNTDELYAASLPRSSSVSLNRDRFGVEWRRYRLEFKEGDDSTLSVWVAELTSDGYASWVPLSELTLTGLPLMTKPMSVQFNGRGPNAALDDLVLTRLDNEGRVLSLVASDSFDDRVPYQELSTFAW